MKAGTNSKDTDLRSWTRLSLFFCPSYFSQRGSKSRRWDWKRLNVIMKSCQSGVKWVNPQDWNFLRSRCDLGIHPPSMCGNLSSTLCRRPWVMWVLRSSLALWDRLRSPPSLSGRAFPPCHWIQHCPHKCPSHQEDIVIRAAASIHVHRQHVADEITACLGSHVSIVNGRTTAILCLVLPLCLERPIGAHSAGREHLRTWVPACDADSQPGSDLHPRNKRQSRVKVRKKR